MYKKTSLILVALLATLSLSGVSQAQTPQGDNVAIAQNTKDNTTVFDLSFNIRRVMASGVDIDNAAAAVSSCEACRSIAVAIQVVLIFSDPDVVTTDNLALALNIECNTCETMALAYQYVLTTEGPVHFSAEGNQAINEILRQLADVEKSADELSLAEIEAAIDPLVEQLYAVVDSELVAAGQPVVDAQEGSATDVASPAPDATSPGPETLSPAPEATPTPADSPSETTSPTSEPSPATTP